MHNAYVLKLYPRQDGALSLTLVPMACRYSLTLMLSVTFDAQCDA